MDIKQVWENVLEKLEKEVSAVSFELWIKSLEPMDFKNNIYYLSTSSETAKQRILNLHKGDIYTALTIVQQN